MVKGKKLLVLGGTYASYDVVKLAREMGVYTIVTDNLPAGEGSAKEIADEVCNISTTDMEKLQKLIVEKKIDGVFCGPSEFNLKNMITLCEKVGLPCYASPNQWEICSNKETFKKYCRKNGVPTAREYEKDVFEKENANAEVEYPVIVKPVDGSSSNGISICYNREEVLEAIKSALSVSRLKRIVIEQYIDNGGKIFSFRYILNDGQYYPYLTFDTYIVDPINKRYLISAFTYFPSEYTEKFFREIDENVQNMFRDMGLKNGVAFIQAIPYKGTIYCHEMGYRLSGGMIYKITEPLMGLNDMKMMIRFALGEGMAEKNELEMIQVQHLDQVMGQLMIPLDAGRIASVEGLEEICARSEVVNFLQYYQEGDAITQDVLGTLGQHFGRFTLKARNKEEMKKLVKDIQCKLKIRNTEGKEMYTMKFDVNRIAD